MIYHLAIYLTKYSSLFNPFHYVSTRIVLAFLISIFFSIFFGGWFIKKLASFLRSGVREYTPENHKLKAKTPTMGGIFIICSVIITNLLCCNLFDIKIWLVMLCLLLFGALGFWDDYSKISKKKGISAKKKFIAQISSATLVTILWVYFTQPSLQLVFPLFKTLQPDFGLFFIIWAVFIIIASSNAVNLADGLDGLATGSLIYNFATFAVIAYLAGHFILSIYLHIPFAETAEIAIVASAFVGSLLGFLWYNTYPAQIFMGDVGSLALGASLGFIALITKQECLLLISGGFFVLETVSVIMQVLSFKLLGKRIFKMAPIHHHFELLGWPETKITIRFAIISIVLCVLALVTLKMR